MSNAAALLRRLAVFLALWPILPGGAQAPAPPTPAATFTNPVREHAADPWVVCRNGVYYMTNTTGGGVVVRKSLTLAGLGAAPDVPVWRAGGPGNEKYTRDVWAPELHFLNGRWYVYYCATDGPDPNRRVFVLRADTDDPQGAYTFKGKLAATDSDDYAIDPTVYQAPRGRLFLLWSGRPPGGEQTIYIAPMSDPWTVSGPRVSLSTPDLDWERHGWPVNEGPEVLRHGGRTLVFYSGSGYTTPDYALGMLVNSDGNMLNPASWAKSPVPVFGQYHGPDGAVEGTGHNGFFKSPDGTEDWIMFHGRDPGKPARHAYAQRFGWAADGTPEFGPAVPRGVALAAPSGEGAGVRTPKGAGTGLAATYFRDGSLTKPALTRLDPHVNFDWRLGAPAPGVPEDHFSARWRGLVQPRFSETYTFQTYADDGVRVWVGGKLLVDDWKTQGPTATQGAIALQAGHKYDIRVDYFEFDKGARVSLAWSSAHQPFEPIPQDRLFPPPKGKSR